MSISNESPSSPSLIHGTELKWLHEDKKHEFKMHTVMCIEDIPRNCQSMDGNKVVRTKQPISKTICAFLNCGGGRVYLGIDDGGIVKGVEITDLKIEHLLHSLDDTIKRFHPLVPFGSVKMKIIPVQMSEVQIPSMLCDDEMGDDPWGGKKEKKIESEENEERAEKQTDEEENEERAEKQTDREENEERAEKQTDGEENEERAEKQTDGEVNSQEQFRPKMDAIHMMRGQCHVCANSIGFGWRHVVIVIEVDNLSNGVIYSNEEGLAYERTDAGNKCLTVDRLRVRMETGKTEKEVEKIRNVLAYIPM